MPKRKRRSPESEPDHAAACRAVGALLNGGARAEIVERAVGSGDLAGALRAIRSGMRAHEFASASGRVSLGGVVKALDARTRREGFSVLQAWDPAAHRFTTETNPVLLLDYVARTGIAPGLERQALATLLDGYFLYVLALLAMRVWDEDDPGAALERVTGLVGDLQGPAGSGHRFVSDAETLLLLAISQYQPDESAYHRLLARLRTLDEAHRTGFARVGAANLGSHLRWGFRFMYRLDPERMRADNEVDYPWLLFCLAALMRAYERMREAGVAGAERETVVEALLNGFSADPGAFTGEPPAFLAEHAEEHAHLRRSLERRAGDLLEEFEAHRPSERRYSPLGFDFNFMHNAMVAKVAVALRRGSAPNLPFNALLERERAGSPLSESPEVLARMMMDFSAEDPTRLVHRGAGLVAYDPGAALRGFADAGEALRRLGGEAGPEASRAAGGGG